MIEYLFPPTELQTITPRYMKIGSFVTFNGNDLLGKGNQAVHNSGSSMLRDTPSFKTDISSFIKEHFKYSDEINTINMNEFIWSRPSECVK